MGLCRARSFGYWQKLAVAVAMAVAMAAVIAQRAPLLVVG